MTALAPQLKTATGIALPAALLLAGLGYLAYATLPLPHLFGSSTAAAVETVTLPPGQITYRAAGQFFRSNKAVDAPLVTAKFDMPLTIMKYQVSAAEYAACVADGACTATVPVNAGSGNVPATNVSFRDASDYATWFSRQTGQTWTLPTDEQWAYAGAERFTDDALNVGDDGSNPALRWLANYEKETRRANEADPMPRALGAFGQNSNGLFDMSGNVWEWTQSCNRRIHIDDAGNALSESSACTVRIVEGKHRAAVSIFVRDARAGGCSVGVPPDNLGFRLVREPQWHEPLVQALGL
ncbi:MAG: hypothetical protein ABS75_03555 [Pelagibacterium sp. SCN 63-23]|nr:MAG: hypothetical protein ABS75_03555 [Pelagibacterium sp. SCN 63-23]